MAESKTSRSKANQEPRYVRETAEVRRRLLVEAAVRCISRGGIAAFTIDQVVKEAEVSRGLINHHFDSKDDLLIAVYEHMTDSLSNGAHVALERDSLEPEKRLARLIEDSFSSDVFNRPNLMVWLALWGEASNNPKMRTAHRRFYDRYRKAVAQAIEDVAKLRRRKVDADRLAMIYIALADGLWLEWVLDPRVLSPEDGKDACIELLERELGPLK